MTRYELLDRIGVGGMAEIFRGKAVAAGGFEKPVAIKRILPHLSQDKRFVELLIAEAKVLSLLKHRNIVQIFDVGLGDDGKYFLVMEYVDGKDLGAIQRGLETWRHRIPFDLALHVGAEICEALEHAHSARAPDGRPMSLVHRDVSPSNVLVSRAGEVKLTDFGIAKRAEQETTGHGAVRGKFAYISPEQARNEHIDPRSDVFSVGILLWELVTSRRLFSGLPDMDALRAVREAQVPRPREADARLGPEIDALIMAALAPDRRDRPTAGQLGARLRSMRYALEVTVGDPATELARIIDAAEDALRQSAPQPAAPRARIEFDGSEPTVIRIHTADAFSTRDKDDGVARAREVIDRFEEEETRQAQLSRDQMALLRASAQRDSGELAAPQDPPLPGMPPRRRADPSEEPTRAGGPLAALDSALDIPALIDPVDSGPSFDADEATRLLPPGRLAPPERTAPRGPAPSPISSAPTLPRSRDRTPAPRERAPGTVHERRPQPPAFQPEPLPPAPVVQVPAMPPAPPPMQAPMMLPPQAAVPLPPPAMLPPQAAPMHPQPPAMQAAPMHPPVPQLPPLSMQPPGGYAPWGPGSVMPPGMAPGMPAMPPGMPAMRARAPRRTPLRPWMLVIGALVMALLAFAVTRAFIHTATRPSVEHK